MNIFLIPARSGSVGIKDKNIQKINGHTLLEHAIFFSRECSCVNDEIYISTDSDRYEQIALKSGAKSFGLRPEHLSDGKAQTRHVILDFLQLAEKTHDSIRNIILIQPTSPIRNKKIFDECLALTHQTGEVVATIKQLEEPHPMKLLTLNEHDNRVAPFVDGADASIPRQLLDKCFFLTGGIYVYPVALIRKGPQYFRPTRGVIHEDCVNIDSDFDLEVARNKMRQ